MRKTLFIALFLDRQNCGQKKTILHSAVRGNEMADRLPARASGNNRVGMDKKGIIKAIVSKLQGQADTHFEVSTHHKLLV